MNTNVTRGTGEFVVTSTGMATEVGHISGMLQTQEDSKSPLTAAAREADQAAGHDRGARAGRLGRDQHVARAELHGGVHRRRGLRDRGDPDRAAGGGHDDPGARHAPAGRGERDRQAPALDRDAGRHLGDLLRQDRDADAQPDDRGRARRSPAAATRSRAPATRPRARSSTSSASPRSTWSSSCCRWRWPATRSSPPTAR